MQQPTDVAVVVAGTEQLGHEVGTRQHYAHATNKAHNSRGPLLGIVGEQHRP